LREFSRFLGEQSLWRAVRTSKDPALFTVLFEDMAALAGLVVALGGVWLSHRLDMPAIDSGASILIGAILAGVALFLVVEAKGLLVGEGASSAVVASICTIAETDPAVEKVLRALTLHFGPHQVLLNMELQFRQEALHEIGHVVERVEQAIREHHPDVRDIFIEARSLSRSA
jgi:divalent metal cation (Fe/Co/Zn/Cd) transporter